MKVSFKLLLVLIFIIGCDSGSNSPVAPSQPAPPPGTKSLSKPESRSESDKPKLAEKRASRK